MILAFDTSNYTTSLALMDDDGKVCKDLRILLEVGKGQRGLRQSEAVSQHLENLPILIKTAFDVSVSAPDPFAKDTDMLCAVTAETSAAVKALSSVSAIGVSSRPRSVEGSYMPCFLAGVKMAEKLSYLLQIPLYLFSHQEGHMAAAAVGTDMEGEQSFLAWHLSGGTCELLQWKWLNESIDGFSSRESVLGGSLDISFGQVLDRMGVAMGMPFPCGKKLDELALNCTEPASKLVTRVKVGNMQFNLSGMETQVLSLSKHEDPGQLAKDVLERIAETVRTATLQAADITGIRKVLMAGGVSSSLFLRDYLRKRSGADGLSVCFGKPEFSADNAVGVGFLTAREIRKSL